jgi:4-amino-4-deoxy-L-arabinose transferase-like glycosyltransferase
MDTMPQPVAPTQSRYQLNKRTLHRLALAVIALGFALRLYTLASESLWYDELLQADIAQGPLLMIFPRLRGHAAVPLDYLISHVWIFLGRGDGWMRIPAVLVGTLTLPLVYPLGRRLLGRTEGLLLMLLLAVAPFHVRYSQEARPYALLVLGAVLAGYGLWRLRATGRWRYVIPLQIGVLVFALAHFFGLAMLGPLVLFAIIDLLFNRQRGPAMQSLVALGAATLLPVAIYLALGWGQTLFFSTRDYGEALAEPEKLTAEAKPDHGLGPQVDAAFIKYEILAPLVGGGGDISLWYLNILAGLGLVYLWTRRQYKVSLLLLLWLGLPIVIVITFLMFRGAFFASRYIIMVVPAYLMLVAVGLLALPRWLRCAEPRWLSLLALLVLGGFVLADVSADLRRQYQQKNKEDWHLVGDFIARNAGPNDAVIAMRAEPAINWYYPPAWTAPNYYWDLDIIKATAARAERSWIILSIFSSTVDDEVQAWLGVGDNSAIRFDLDPLISVYYYGPGASREQLLEEVRGFVLPVDPAIYASLGWENRQQPAIARRYYQLAIEHAPTDQARAEYQATLETLTR